MPLYTYIAAFKEATYASQGSYSNFKGFVTARSDLPANALPGLTPSLNVSFLKCRIRSTFGESQLTSMEMSSSFMLFKRKFNWLLHRTAAPPAERQR